MFRHPRTLELSGTPSFRAASKKRRFFGVAATLFGALSGGYFALVVAVSASAIILPGNELVLPGITLGVPGIAKLQITLPLDDIPLDFPVDLPIIGSSGGNSLQLESERPINILVMGIDHTLDFGPEGDPGRTDTIFVVSIDPESKTASILNFPRDTWINVPSSDGGWTLDRINTAYTRGIRNNDNDEEKGPEYAIATIEHNFGIPIDHWVVVDWHGFIRIVDSVGGVLIENPDDLFDPISHILDPFGGSLDRGWYLMDGEQALAYSRYRADSDLHRIERQHQVIFALLDRLDLDQVLADPLGLWGEYQDAVTTDINTVQIPGLGLLAKQIGRDGIRAFSLGPAAQDFTTSGGGAVLVLDPVIAAQIVRQAMPAQFTGGVRVAIVNGGDRFSWATMAKTLIVANGAPEFFIQPDDRLLPRPFRRSVIINYTGDRAVALAMANALGLGEERIVDANAMLGEFDVEPRADIVIIAGQDLALEPGAGSPGGSP